MLNDLVPDDVLKKLSSVASAAGDFALAHQCRVALGEADGDDVAKLAAGYAILRLLGELPPSFARVHLGWEKKT